MKRIYFKLLALIMLIILVGGCARYARSVNMLYDPAAVSQQGSGDLYIVIPENQVTPSAQVKWVLGTVTDDENKKIDELFSPRSPAELAQSALTQELKQSGYTVLPTAKRPEAHVKLIDISKVDISLNQLSDFADLKATCRVLIALDVYKNGKLIRKLEYQSLSSKTDIKDRDLLARVVLQEALQSVMTKALPDLIQLFER